MIVKNFSSRLSRFTQFILDTLDRSRFLIKSNHFAECFSVHFLIFCSKLLLRATNSYFVDMSSFSNFAFSPTDKVEIDNCSIWDALKFICFREIERERERGKVEDWMSDQKPEWNFKWVKAKAINVEAQPVSKRRGRIFLREKANV